MPTYVSLVNWTEQGVKTFRDTVRRGEDYRGPRREERRPGSPAAVDPWGVRRGRGDRLPDDETATAVLLQTAAGGSVRTKTMKAFDAEQMNAIIQRTG